MLPVWYPTSSWHGELGKVLSDIWNSIFLETTYNTLGDGRSLLLAIVITTSLHYQGHCSGISVKERRRDFVEVEVHSNFKTHMNLNHVMYSCLVELGYWPYHFSSVHSHSNHHGVAMIHRTATATTEMRQDTVRRSVGHGSRQCGRMVGRHAHPPKWFSFFFFFIILYRYWLFHNRRPPAIASRSDKVGENQPSALATPPLINSHPEPLKTSVCTCFQGLWVSFDHHSISTLNIECSCSFSGLVGSDVSPSTVQENAQAFGSFFKQAGIGDTADDTNARVKLKSPANSAILIFRDLLTGRHIWSLLESQLVERTPWWCFQFMVYVMGLFHLKMACADAIWRIFIQPKNSDKDPNSLMSFISQIHPKETGKFKSKPGFRWMHEIIDHIGKVLRLNELGNVALKINTSHTTLDEFAKSEPTWASIHAMIQQVVRNSEVEIDELRAKDAGERDKQRENILLMHKYFLLYEEISYTMNHGDIRRVEDCFTPWIWIFMGCGKLKYAVEMQRYLENIHFRFLAGLKYVLLQIGKFWTKGCC